MNFYYTAIIMAKSEILDSVKCQQGCGVAKILFIAGWKIFLIKLNVIFPHDPVDMLLSIDPNGLNSFHTETFTSMTVEALVIIVEKWQRLESLNRQLNK